MTPAEIKAIRKRYGLSQPGLAVLLRVSDVRTIRRWEKGEVPVSGPASIILELMDADELPNRFWP
jgi:DNA-binding transcriptional regulator YiaG